MSSYGRERVLVFPRSIYCALAERARCSRPDKTKSFYDRSDSLGADCAFSLRFWTFNDSVVAISDLRRTSGSAYFTTEFSMPHTNELALVV